MERILSQEEISELLSAVKHGDIEPEPEEAAVSDSGSVCRLDLVRAGSNNELRLNNLDLILDSFARNYAITLTNRIQQPANVKRTAISSMECESYLNHLKDGAAIGVYKLEPLRHGILVVFESELSFAMVELLLGGNLGTKSRMAQRPLTSIELNILDNSIGDASLDLVKALGDLDELTIEPQGIQNNPRMVNLIPADAMTIVAKLDVEMNGAGGQMHLVIPNSVLDPLREKLQARDQPDNLGDNNWQKHLRSELPLIQVELSAELGTINLEMRDFINFQVGDIIDLPWNPSDPLTIQVEGRPKYFAQAGIRNGNKAVRISGIYQEGAEHGN
ncbi:flagellar motor switch protein FliM [Geothermobacter hydrogeniphilus]|uniref:Flagellar motor switch protein FliM n=1 Tax=Geothermobacter hydrogeniphilus TaxID=1969733 RepID=A0A2K2HCU7_9BACT|nr:flagellar motor switch protein FliM [Geothermobacter hydrogeniphilus]PNU21128.1 flagellar motor switch protein FliM [Geothermobacter hydrogeniphilus]